MKIYTPEDVGFSTQRLERINIKMQQLIDDGRIAGCVSLIMRLGIQQVIG